MFSFFKRKKKDEDFTIERRSEARLRAVDGLQLQFFRKFQKMPKTGHGRNISPNGMRFATPFYVNKGEKIDVTLYFSKKYRGKDKVNLKAKVVNFARPRGASRYRAGCRFLQMEDDARQEIEKFLKWLEPRQVTSSI